ncbi:SHIRT domain-containing protein [Gleimia hominis]|uniref:SHIRT domain-containing protein n=1 Tax=Gleimia hominis TaxID=595468 RepID=A0ABU3ICU1_9ACTO|nr:SHIRT domain-containing protein [Gleimia hominis]MDT3768191.1 SHIRT domain-containing protein [Gleimia hominis]
MVSPVYTTVSDAEGKFAFDLSKPFYDALGRANQFHLAGATKGAPTVVRTWADNPHPDKWMQVKGGDFQQGRFHDRLTRKNENWDFTVGVERIHDGEVVFQERPNIQGWLAKPQKDWTYAPTSDQMWRENGIYGRVSGKVWWEQNDPIGADSSFYGHDSKLGDRASSGMKVVASYVNDEVARQFDSWKTNNPNYTRDQFAAAQKQIVMQYQAEHGEGSHIAESNVGFVKQDSTFYIPFRGLYGVNAYQAYTGTKLSQTVSDQEFGTLVRDEDLNNSSLLKWNGTIGQKHRHINSDYMYIYPVTDNPTQDVWMNAFSDNMFQDPVKAGVEDNTGKIGPGYVVNYQNFALLKPTPMHDVTNYNISDKIAKIGDTAQSTTTGLTPYASYKIQWYKDGDKKLSSNACYLQASPEGSLASCPLTVPDDITQPTLFTSIVEDSNGTNILADVFLADPTFLKYDDVTGIANARDVASTPSFDNPDTISAESKPEGAKFTFADTETARKLGMILDADTGVITWPKDKQVAGETSVAVKMSWRPTKDSEEVSRSAEAKFILTQGTITASYTYQSTNRAYQLPSALTPPPPTKHKIGQVLTPPMPNQKKLVVDGENGEPSSQWGQWEFKQWTPPNSDGTKDVVFTGLWSFTPYEFPKIDLPLTGGTSAQTWMILGAIATITALPSAAWLAWRRKTRY